MVKTTKNYLFFFLIMIVHLFKSFNSELSYLLMTKLGHLLQSYDFV